MANSVASPLPAAFCGAKFRCRQAKPKRLFKPLIGIIFWTVRGGTFKSQNRFFPAVREKRPYAFAA